MEFTHLVPAVTLRAFLREPLLHFLLAGSAMFVAVSAWQGNEPAGQTIRIDRDDLLVFMQGRARVYDEETFAQIFERMPTDERAQLVREAVLQEALYREGEALGLADVDPLVRQRIVQQARTLLTEEAMADLAVNDGEARAYFAANTDRYAQAPTITFTHVFVPDEDAGAVEEARQTLRELRTRGVTADSAGPYGERFLYHSNYSDTSGEVVASHFGSEFAKRVFALEPGEWQGPIRSQYGQHLVFPLAIAPVRRPAFDEVAEEVRADALAEKRQRAADRALDRLMERYPLELAGDIAR